MVRRPAVVVALVFFAGIASAQKDSEAFKQAMARGDLYESKHKYDLALGAYELADKLGHHESAVCYLKLASVQRKLGDFSSALDDTKKAIKVAGNDKEVASKAYTMRAILLVRQSGKPTDKKLKEAEEDMRQVIALNSQQAMAHFNLGTILLKQERDADGIAELNRALALAGLDERSSSEARKFIASPIRAREPFAPDFDFMTKESQRMNNASLRGKVVLLDFWGTWCPPCRESIPTTRNVYKKYQGKGLEVIGVSSDDDEDVWRAFVEAQKMDWHEYIDLSGNVINAFDVDSYPTYVVLDKDGVVRFRQSGFGPTTEGELEDAIGRALKKSSDPALAKAAAAAAPAQKEQTHTVAAIPAERKGESGKAGITQESAQSVETEKESRSAIEDRPFGIEAGVVSGSTYKNAALNLVYEFPSGWSAATSEKLHSLNVKAEASAKASLAQQRPDLGNTTILMMKNIFYVSKRGDGDAEKLMLPCIRISAIPSRVDSISVGQFQKMAENMAGASSGKLMQPVSEFVVKDHPFVRADIERMAGGMHIYQSYVQTLAADYLLTIEIYATSAEELKKAVTTLETMVIKDE
jgi:thiol-disulfide isomerase/thioredoxin